MFRAFKELLNNGEHMTTRVLFVSALLVALGCGSSDPPSGADASHATSTGGAAGTNAIGHVCPGNYAINDAEGLAAIVNCTAITGNLVVANTMLTDLSLPKLVAVDSFFNCQVNAALTSVSLPARRRHRHLRLTSVGPSGKCQSTSHKILGCGAHGAGRPN